MIQIDPLEKEFEPTTSLRSCETRLSRTGADLTSEKHKWLPVGGQGGGGERHKSRESWENRSSGGGVLNGNKQRRVRQHGKAVKK